MRDATRWVAGWPTITVGSHTLAQQHPPGRAAACVSTQTDRSALNLDQLRICRTAKRTRSRPPPIAGLGCRARRRVRCSYRDKPLAWMSIDWPLCVKGLSRRVLGWAAGWAVRGCGVQRPCLWGFQMSVLGLILISYARLGTGQQCQRPELMQIQAVQAAYRDELARVRTADLAWRNGLGGLLAGLVGSSSSMGGPT